MPRRERERRGLRVLSLWVQGGVGGKVVGEVFTPMQGYPKTGRLVSSPPACRRVKGNGTDCWRCLQRYRSHKACERWLVWTWASGCCRGWNSATPWPACRLPWRAAPCPRSPPRTRSGRSQPEAKIKKHGS